MCSMEHAQTNKNNIKSRNAIKCPSDFVNHLCYEFNIKFQSKLNCDNWGAVNATVQKMAYLRSSVNAMEFQAFGVCSHWASTNVYKMYQFTTAKPELNCLLIFPSCELLREINLIWNVVLIAAAIFKPNHCGSLTEYTDHCLSQMNKQ